MPLVPSGAAIPEHGGRRRAYQRRNVPWASSALVSAAWPLWGAVQRHACSLQACNHPQPLPGDHYRAHGALYLHRRERRASLASLLAPEWINENNNIATRAVIHLISILHYRCARFPAFPAIHSFPHSILPSFPALSESHCDATDGIPISPLPRPTKCLSASSTQAALHES